MKYDSILQLNEFQVHNGKKEYIVEDVYSAEYYEMNASAVEALKLIDQGKTLKEVEDTLLIKFPDDDIDVLAFSQQLLDLGLATKGNKTTPVRARISNVSLLNRIPPTIAQAFFNPITYKLYLLLFFANAALLLIYPQFLPHYSDFYVSDSLAVSMLTYLVLSIVLVFIHEMGHVLAVRSYELTTSLSISHRLFLVVIETDMTHAWRLDKQKRNHLYLAGICFDSVLFFTMIVIQLFSPYPLLQALASLVVLDLFIKFIYQCCVYMKTDFYYVLENITGYYNLMERSKEWLFRRKQVINSMREALILTLYGVIYLLGVIASIGIFVVYVIPQFQLLMSLSLRNLSYPYNTYQFWDGLVVVFQLCILVSLLLTTWARSIMKKKEA